MAASRVAKKNQTAGFRAFFERLLPVERRQLGGLLIGRTQLYRLSSVFAPES